MGGYGTLKSGVLSSCAKFQKPFHNNVKGKAKGVCAVSGGMVQLERETKFIFIVGSRHEARWQVMGAYEHGLGDICI